VKLVKLKERVKPVTLKLKPKRELKLKPKQELKLKPKRELKPKPL